MNTELQAEMNEIMAILQPPSAVNKNRIIVNESEDLQEQRPVKYNLKHPHKGSRNKNTKERTMSPDYWVKIDDKKRKEMIQFFAKNYKSVTNFAKTQKIGLHSVLFKKDGKLSEYISRKKYQKLLDITGIDLGV